MVRNNVFERLRVETLYLISDFDDLVIMVPVSGPVMAKQKGGEPYQISTDSELYMRAISGEDEISEKEYLSY